MYNKKKYGYVEVFMDKNDYALEDLIWHLPPQLYDAGLVNGKVCFRGLLRKDAYNYNRRRAVF